MADNASTEVSPTAAASQILEFSDNRLLIDLCGEFGRNLAQVEQALSVQVLHRGNELVVSGSADATDQAVAALNAMYERLEDGRSLEKGDIDAAIRFGGADDSEIIADVDQMEMFKDGKLEIRTRKKPVEPRTETQKRYVAKLFNNELVFGIGPAGTGKTYLAVAAGVSLFLDGHVDKIVLSRPAVEAGERLGFLPGDMKDKVDPYMQPLYDALSDFLPGKQLAKLIEDKRIEIAPLAFMRGRTLSNAFVVLDEGQNATAMQMKMFLTRLGEGSRMAITGDVTQIDLPRGQPSGLVEAMNVLKDVPQIGFSYFKAADVVRHPLVAKIIRAYEAASDAK